MKFDENGFRSDFKLRLQELTREGLRVVGHWNTTGVFFMPNYTKAMAEGYRQTLKNRTLTVVTKIGSPYAMEVENWRELGKVRKKYRFIFRYIAIYKYRYIGRK